MNNRLAEIFKNNYGDIFAVIYNKTKNKHLSHEIIQRTFFKLLNSKSKPKDTKLLSYVIVAAGTTLLDHYRSLKTRRKNLDDNRYDENILDMVDNNLSIEDVIVLDDNNKLIKKLIDSLLQEQKDIIIYRYYKYMTFKQIAKKTNVSINTALGRHRYAINNLKKLTHGLDINNFR
tara:strand:- start:5268 stop:5792 length:525 start_codon:yes stop_codon:yes gene_type:complete